MHYVEGFLLAVPNANKDRYRAQAEAAQPLFAEFGASRLVETWSDDVHRGERTDMWRAVQAGEDESVVFSWIAYPDKATRDAASARMMSDPRMEVLGEMPFDARRMATGGFAIGVDAGPGGRPAYVDGFVAPVPPGGRDRYMAFAADAAQVFLDYGALRVVEAWGDDVPHGELTDFHRAVDAGEGEGLVFSWIEWPDKAARVAGWEKAMADERMQGGDMPFDGKRMIYGGFTMLLDA